MPPSDDTFDFPTGPGSAWSGLMDAWSARHHSRCDACGLDLDARDCGERFDGEPEPLESAEREW